MKIRSLLTWGLLAAATHVMGYTITVSPIEIEAGQSTNLIINLSNTETNLTAYQMSLYLPEGVTVKKKSNGKYSYTSNTNRLDPDLFTITVKDAADGSILIAVFSPDKDVIAGTSGELIRLPIEVASTVTTSLQGGIKNIEFTDVNSQAHKVSDISFNLTYKQSGSDNFTITVTASPANGGTVLGGGSYAKGTVVKLVATPNDGYKFTKWNDGVTDNPRMVTVTRDMSFTAMFDLIMSQGLGILSCEDVTLTAGGETVYLEVMLTTNNVEAISGIQFNFDLPQGVTIALDEDEELDVSFPIAKKAHNCGIMNTDAGGYLVYLGGDNSLTYKATTNPVAKIGLTAKKEDVADGKYIINFVKAAMSDKSDPVQSFDVPDFKATLTIITLKGDLNGDSKVDIADAVTVLNIMAAGGYEAKADLNDDQKIDVADFVTVLNIMAAN